MIGFKIETEEDLKNWQRFEEAVTYAHLYYQQHLIDEFKIDYTEFRNRIDPFNIPVIMTEFATQLDLLGNENEKIYLQRALDLINNPPSDYNPG
jgi:hypothetical protein